jgi:hypothetical protein
LGWGYTDRSAYRTLEKLFKNSKTMKHEENILRKRKEKKRKEEET